MCVCVCVCPKWKILMVHLRSRNQSSNEQLIYQSWLDLVSEYVLYYSSCSSPIMNTSVKRNLKCLSFPNVLWFIGVIHPRVNMEISIFGIQKQIFHRVFIYNWLYIVKYQQLLNEDYWRRLAFLEFHNEMIICGSSTSWVHTSTLICVWRIDNVIY